MEKKEIKDILISWITISFAFAWIGLQIFSPKGLIEFAINFLIISIAVGSGFILHELAHKYVAINFGAKAKYIAWKEGLLLAVALAIITNGTFVFAAPGAVYVYGKKILTKENGIISIAGPVTNILVSLAASITGILLSPTGLILTIIKYTIIVNFFLAAFNLIPIGPLDGKKVFLWSKTAWAITMLIAISGVILNEQYLRIIGLA
jgi:Zn-dependent protease